MCVCLFCLSVYFWKFFPEKVEKKKEEEEEVEEEGGGREEEEEHLGFFTF